jgi:hypothetical protein
MPEFHQRVGVLQQLGYVSPDGTVTLKGRAACEINSTQVRRQHAQQLHIRCVCQNGAHLQLAASTQEGVM